MSVNQAVAALRVHRSTLYEMVADGRLSDHRIGEHRVFWAPEVQRVADALNIARPRRG